MTNDVSLAFKNEQFGRMQKMWGQVALAALDDAISDDKKYGNGQAQIERWLRSRVGRDVLSNAGVQVNEKVVKAFVDLVGNGIPTSICLSKEEMKRNSEDEGEEDEYQAIAS